MVDSAEQWGRAWVLYVGHSLSIDHVVALIEPAANIHVQGHQGYALKNIAYATDNDELNTPAVQALKQCFSFLNHAKAEP